MPVVLRSGPYRLHFFSHEPPGEPAYVHVDRDGLTAKVWLEAPAIVRHNGYRAKELGTILRIVRDHRVALIEEWNGFHGRC